MAKAKKQPLLLHCKCNQCTAWEIEYDPIDHDYYLKCASCPVKILITMFSLEEPQVSLHWEAATTVRGGSVK